MADKQQNIKVVWNVDTSQLDRAKAAAQGAQQAADKFTQTVGQGARNSSTELNKLVAEEKRLETAIRSTSQAQFKNYKEFVKNLQNLSKQYSDVKTKIDFMNKSLADQAREQKKVNDATKQAAQNTGQLAGQFNNLYAGVKAVIAAGLLKYTVSTALEMAKLSGNVEGVTRAFYRAFPQGEVLINDLQRATHGAVSEFELMQRTLQATNLGVAVESLPVLFEFAATRAQQTGESVDYLVDSIVRGIGRKSILVLDNLGLSATRLREQFNGASLASQSVANVTKGVAEIAKVELEKMGGYAETTATKVDQLTVSWKELEEEVAKFATQEGGLVDFFKGYVDSYKLLFEAINKGISVEDLAAQKRREEWAQGQLNIFTQKELTGTKEENIKAVEQEIIQVAKAISSWKAFRDEMDKNIENIKKEYEGKWLLSGIRDQEIRQTERIRDAKKEDALVDMEILKLLKLKLDALKEVEKVQESIGLIEAKMAQIESVEESIKAAKSTTEIHKLNIELSRLNGELADLKAFGTTKQFLEVDGKIKLVPVEEYKVKQYKVTTQNRIGELEVKTKLVLGANKDDSVGVKQLEADIQQMIDGMRFNIPTPAPLSPGITPMSDSERIGQAFADQWQDILNQGIDDTTMFFDSVIMAEADQYDARLNQARAFYDEQILLASKNERRQLELKIISRREEDRLRREAFEKEKEARRSMTVINGAAGIIRAFATLDFYQAIAASAVIAAETVAQLAAINQQAPRFKDGVIDLKGPGTKTSDSIHAKLSRGESVMTADQTQSSKGLLNDIRNGKLSDDVFAKTVDDKVLEKLKLTSGGVTMVGMDDSRIVEEIRQLRDSQPDIIERYGTLWVSKKKSDTFKNYVKAKSF